jgi:RND family efflux transporter MFP subunit
MSSDELPSKIQEPRPRRLLVVSFCVLVGAGLVVAGGVRGRAKIEQEVVRRTIDQSIPIVEVVQPQRGGTAREIVLPGNVEAFSTAPIYARASGYVTAWFKDIGDRVKSGERLAEIDTPELDQQYAQAKADVANAQVNAAMSAGTAKRYHELVGRAIVSKQTDEEKTADANAKQAILESARANLARLEALVAFKTLTAPFDGIVTTRSLDVGTLLNAGGTTGTALYQVADIHRVRIYVRVPQAYVADLRPGTKATLQVRQFPGRTFEATLVGSSNAIAQESRTALIQLQADNPDGELWPGTYAEVHFQLAPNQEALRIPATALIFSDRGLRVATVDDSGVVSLKPVQIGRDIGNEVEVIAGLAASDRIINSPLETLGIGDKVRVAKANRAAPDVAQVGGPVATSR